MDTNDADYFMHEECSQKLLDAIKKRLSSSARDTAATGNITDRHLREMRDFQYELEILARKVGLDADTIVEAD